MLLLPFRPIRSLPDALELIELAVRLELSTLPPYLYALYTIAPGTNGPASSRIREIVMEEMIHMALACNLHNALGATPRFADAALVPTYPGQLPGDIGSETGAPFVVHLLPFSAAAMEQGVKIEEPEHPIDFPEAAGLMAATPSFMTIGQFYAYLDAYLAGLPVEVWHKGVDGAGRNQLVDTQFFAGELFPIVDYASAHVAIERIVSEGEGTSTSPLDFEHEVAHFYRFEEIRRDAVLTKSSTAKDGYVWVKPLGVDFAQAAPAIANPGQHDFSGDPAAQAAQDACDEAYTRMLDELQRAVGGDEGRLGNAVRAMFDLRMAAAHALATPLAGTDRVAGPAFRYRRVATEGSTP